MTYPEFDATLTALKQGTAPVLKQDLLATYMLTPLGRKTKQPTSLVNKPLDIGKPKRQLIYTSNLHKLPVRLQFSGQNGFDYLAMHIGQPIVSALESRCQSSVVKS